MAKTNGNFQCHVAAFDGDPQTVNFFFGQIADLQAFNKWTDPQAIAFLKGKLVGSAQKFFIDSSEASKATDLNALKDIFVKFFRPKSAHVARSELFNLNLLPGESINNLAHRLDSLVKIVHDGISDDIAINSIKVNYFLQAIPQEFKIKILEADINEFSKAVVKAQQLQDICSNSQILVPTTSSQPTIAELTAQINHLKEELQSVKTSNNNEKDQSPFKRNNNRKRGFKNFDNKRKPYFKSFAEKPFQNVIKCQYCNKNGHIMRNCFLFKREVNESKEDKPRYNSSFQRGRYNNRGRGLNPNSKSFVPRGNLNEQ